MQDIARHDDRDLLSNHTFRRAFLNGLQHRKKPNMVQRVDIQGRILADPECKMPAMVL